MQLTRLGSLVALTKLRSLADNRTVLELFWELF